MVLIRASSLDFVQFKIRTIESQETKVALGFVTFVDKDLVEDIAVGPWVTEELLQEPSAEGEIPQGPCYWRAFARLICLKKGKLFTGTI